jgi:hypothetical protein
LGAPCALCRALRPADARVGAAYVHGGASVQARALMANVWRVWENWQRVRILVRYKSYLS